MSNMVVRTNVFSLNAHRNMKNVGLEQGRASTRLASGYRINSASDDAAGLAISETMRAQIRGLDKANRNSQDGISMLQTAEGGLAEVVSMIQRVRELTVQGANDTNVSVNREQIAYEIFALTREIRATESRVQFNGINLLYLVDDDENAGLHGRFIQTGANSDQGFAIDLNLTNLNSAYDLSEFTLLFATASMLNHAALAMLGAAGNNHYAGSSFNYTGNPNLAAPNWPPDNPGGWTTDNPGTGFITTPNLGANQGVAGTTPIHFDTPAEWTSYMIGNVDTALGKITSVRASLGAYMNRLEHTMRSLDVSKENMSDAESRVRNADMAREMMRFTMSNVLQQTGVSMLSQSNQLPNNLLQLLR